MYSRKRARQAQMKWVRRRIVLKKTITTIDPSPLFYLSGEARWGHVLRSQNKRSMRLCTQSFTFLSNLIHYSLLDHGCLHTQHMCKRHLQTCRKNMKIFCLFFVHNCLLFVRACIFTYLLIVRLCICTFFVHICLLAHLHMAFPYKWNKYNKWNRYESNVYMPLTSM